MQFEENILNMEEIRIKVITAIIIAMGILTAILTYYQNYLRDELDRYKTLESGNPLFPCRISVEVEVDYSNLQEEQKLAVYKFRDYVHSFRDSTGNYFSHFGINLPRKNFIMSKRYLTYKDFNPSNNFTQDEFEPAGFYIVHRNLISAILPEVFIAFFYKNSEMNFEKADLYLSLTDFSTEAKSEARYSYYIDLDRQTIRFVLNNPDPLIERNNGFISSIYSCRNGKVGVGVSTLKKGASNTKPISCVFEYGHNYSSKIKLLFSKESRFKNQVVSDRFYDREFTFKRGRDVLEQLK
jgi:hypothetical protein